MARATKEEREATARAKAWQKCVREAAYDRVRAALDRAGIECSDQGGLVVTIADPDGQPVRYFLRLTVVRQ
jgi:hypothetical protein